MLGRTFGPVGKGVFSFAQYVVVIGVAAGEGVRSAFAHASGKNVSSARSLWGGSLVLIAALGGLASSVCVVLALRDPTQIAYPFLAVALPAVVYAQAVNLLWSMFGRLETLNVRNTLTVGAGASVVAAIALAVFHAPLSAVLAIWTLGIVAGAVWATFGVSSFLGGTPVWPSRVELREQSIFAAKATLSQLTTFLARRIDIFVVAALATPRAFGIYALAVSTAELMFQISNSVTWAAIGRVATLEARDASALVARIVRSLLAVQTLAALALFTLGPWAVSAVYGRRFAEAGLPLRLMLPGVVCYSADQLLSFYISARSGRPGLLLLFEGISLAVCAAASIYGVTRYGIAGAAAANTITYVIAFAIKTTYFAAASGRGPGEILVARWSDAPERLRLRLRGGR